MRTKVLQEGKERREPNDGTEMAMTMMEKAMDVVVYKG